MATADVALHIASKRHWKGLVERRSLWPTTPQRWHGKGANTMPFVYTLYLFTRSDLKTIFIPVTVFGTVFASCGNLRDIFLTAVWVWLHLLQFCVSNQSLPGGATEDAVNKPWRPIPAGRITLPAARRLRWVLALLCLALSSALHATVPGLALAVVFWGNNELALDSHWALRNLFNGLGYGGFNLGATYVASGGSFSVLSSAAVAHALASLVIVTTIQAQDFQDASGDAARGRRTLPLVYPREGRAFTAIAILAWSLMLSMYSCLTPAVGFPFVALGVFVGARFLWCTTEASDRGSYIYYNIWLCFAQVVPLAR